MYVPNFVPEPLEVPGNVAQAPYAPRMAFARRFYAVHLATVGAVTGLSLLPWTAVGTLGPAIAALALITGMELVRIRLRGRAGEPLATAFLFVPLLLVLGLLTHEAVAAGWPMWSLALAAVIANGYGVLAGRDFSFVGGGILGGGVLAAVILLVQGYLGVAFVAGFSYLVFLFFDGASILSRRRFGEEWGAVMDLYRDVLNLFGYVPRVIAHWRRYRIWGEMPFGFDLPKWKEGR